MILYAFLLIACGKIETEKRENMAVLPASGISVSIVKTTLGTGENNIGALCQHNNINMWSLWKPLKADLETLTEADVIGLHSGLDVQLFQSPISLARYLYNFNNWDWHYIRPTSRFRLGDFRNYNHNARKIIGMREELKTTYFLGDVAVPDQKIDPRVDAISSFNPGEISWDKLQFPASPTGIYNLKDWYFAMIAYTDRVGVSDNLFIETSPAVISNGTTNIPYFYLKDLAVGEWFVCFCLSKKQFFDMTPGSLIPGDNQYVNLPLPAYTINIYNIVVIISITGTAEIDRSYSGCAVYPDIVITNNSDSTVTLKNSYIKIRYASNSFTAPDEQGEYSPYRDENIVIPAKGTFRYSTTWIYMDPRKAASGIKIYFQNSTVEKLNKYVSITPSIK